MPTQHTHPKRKWGLALLPTPTAPSFANVSTLRQSILAQASVLSTLQPKPPGRSPAPSWGVAPPPLAFRLVYTASGAYHLLPLSHFPKKILCFHSGLWLIEASLVSRGTLSSTSQSCHENRVAPSGKSASKPVDNGENGDKCGGISDGQAPARVVRRPGAISASFVRCKHPAIRNFQDCGSYACEMGAGIAASPHAAEPDVHDPKGQPPALRRFGAPTRKRRPPMAPSSNRVPHALSRLHPDAWSVAEPPFPAPIPEGKSASTVALQVRRLRPSPSDLSRPQTQAFMECRVAQSPFWLWITGKSGKKVRL